MTTANPALEDKVERSKHRFESKEKMVIADMLKRYGMPFFYKHPTLVDESGQKTIEYADFFLPAYNGLAIDYIVNTKSIIYLRIGQNYTQKQMQAAHVTRLASYDRRGQSGPYKKRERVYHRRPVYCSSGSYR